MSHVANKRADFKVKHMKDLTASDNEPYIGSGTELNEGERQVDGSSTIIHANELLHIAGLTSLAFLGIDRFTQEEFSASIYFHPSKS